MTPWALSNSAGLERCVMSPVWIMNEGLAGSDLTFARASSSVPITLGLAGLSKPTWLSLICRKLSLLVSAAMASSMMPSERGTPPEIVHSTPVPAQVMHSNTFRRLTPPFPSPFVGSLMMVLLAFVGLTRLDRTRARLYSRNHPDVSSGSVALVAGEQSARMPDISGRTLHSEHVGNRVCRATKRKPSC